MSTMAQLHRLSLLNHHNLLNTNRSIDLVHSNLAFYSQSTCPKLVISPLQITGHFLTTKFHVPLATMAYGGGNNDGIGGFSGGGGGSGGNDGDDSSDEGFGPVGAFLNGWRSRVAADPQFPFKVLMEEIVGLSACVLGDMASRPNFGLNELDLVFSTLVVCFILNFTLMYILAPTMASSGTALPSFFASCPSSHMFEPGPFSVLDRFGTFVYKGMLFAAVGFTAGLVGTALSNGLLTLRKKMDPTFETPNKPPRTMLNALTWAAQVGLSANLRYQTLNGVEYVLAKGLPSFVFKTSVVVLRVVNNVMGGMSFVILARLTGSQSSGAAERKPVTIEEAEILAAGVEKDKLLHNFESTESVPK
ncbi:protein RETICULATA-RELATED 3, chloroplastic [Heracleum sosnowskyi]|uniref:Protein RETICULATA-RELATED 3, chloroplastic n=1 Tax=Heracleum sosnowskyi TaxID=360622 RepID=A0AAD8GNG4_9APIA|nr:protein RETICULATA-RELATED 3, chloroplastic [Heracleum sosnowskyi]